MRRTAPFAIFLAMIAAPSQPAIAGPEIITGSYQGDDGGSYFVRFLQDRNSALPGRVFWFGESPNGTFANVFEGAITAEPTPDHFTVSGEWWDVPKGSTPAHGSLVLSFSPTGISKRSESGDHFGGSSWTKTSVAMPRNSIPRSGFADGGATGIWRGNDGGIYYVRQSAGDFVWFGEACSGGVVPDFANVYRARQSGASTVAGRWADVPYGRGALAGQLDLSIRPAAIGSVGPVAMGRMRVTGGFGGSGWLRGPALAGLTVSALRVTITTGGDDLRIRSAALGNVGLAGGRILPTVNLNRGRVFADGTTHIMAPVRLPPRTTIMSLASFTLTLVGSRESPDPDNWNVDAIQIVALTAAGSFCLAGHSGRPFVRLTRDSPSRLIDLRIPFP